MKIINDVVYLTEAEFDQWIAALRSGKYLQGTGVLCRTEANSEGESEKTYCCLGVLSKQLGLLDEDGCALGSDHYLRTPFYSYLATINDVSSTFQEIADWLVEYKAVFLIPEVLPPVA